MSARHFQPTGGGPLLLKDPRLAWTLGLWLEALRGLDGEEAPVLVLVARSPLTNARSLRRNEQRYAPSPPPSS